MTDETTAVEETPEEPSTEPTLAEKHLELKRQAADRLHRYGDNRGYCDTFDRVLEECGIPGRDYVDGYRRTVTVELTGEDTEEAFQAWRLEASRGLHEEARHRGFGRENVDVIMQEAGLLTRREVFKPVIAVVEGNFRYEIEVETQEGQDLIDAVPNHHVREQVYTRFNTDEVQWKVTVAPDQGKDDPA